LVETAGGSSIAGSRLKSTSGWYNHGNGTDDYGFSALPGGYRDGGFLVVGSSGHWWSATENGGGYRYMYSGSSQVGEHDFNDGYCWFSARCVR
jgi:uncharacterized protein (TIGR02145 family)